MEVVLLLMTYLQKYVFRVKQKDVNVKVKFKIYNMIKRINEVKTLTKYFSCNCKCKSIVHSKKIVLGILAHVFAKIIGS